MKTFLEAATAAGLPITRHPVVKATPMPEVTAWFNAMEKARKLAFRVSFTVGTAVAVGGCVTETTRTITTDKSGTVTDTTVVKKGTDPAALKLVEVAAAIYVPRRPIVVREEKADHDMRRLLRGRAITDLEIAFRWKPLP